MAPVAVPDGIASSLRDAKATITRSIDLIYGVSTEENFERWLGTASGATMACDGITLGNLQADLQLVLQNVEALSRRFSSFIQHLLREICDLLPCRIFYI